MIKIALPGLLHLRLLKNVTYLAACAEDVLFKDASIMTTITRRLASDSYTSKTSMALTAHEMIEYLIEYRKEFCSYPEQYICDEKKIDVFNLNECKEIIEKWVHDDPYVKEEFTNIKLFSPGTIVYVNVENKNKGGLICLFGNNKSIKGFISVYDKKYQLDYSEYKIIVEGENLKCEIMEFNHKHNSFQLKYIAKVD